MEAVQSSEPTTTNTTESFHSSFRKSVAENSSFWGVVDDLRRLETKVRVRFDENQGRVGLNLNLNRDWKKKADNMAKDLKAVIDRRLEFPSKAHFLKRLGQWLE
jgi:hypothetical protein